MHLSDSALLAADPPLVRPLRPENVQPASIDLTLGATLLVPQKLVHGAIVDLRRGRPGEYFDRVRVGRLYVLRPGAAVLGATAETVCVPRDLVARVEGKSSLGRVFLAVHVTAGFVDPGFEGEVTLEIVNHGPLAITLYEGMAIAQINFARLCCPSLRPYGSPGLGSHYQGQSGPTAATGNS